MFHQIFGRCLSLRIKALLLRTCLLLSCSSLCLYTSGCRHGIPPKFAKEARDILDVNPGYHINDTSLRKAALDLFPKGTPYREVYSYFKKKELLIRDKPYYDTGKQADIQMIFEHNTRRGERGVGFKVTWHSFPYFSHLYTLAYIFKEDSDGLVEVRSDTLTESF